VDVSFNDVELLLLILAFLILLLYLSCLFLIRRKMLLFIDASIWWIRLNVIRNWSIFSIHLEVIIILSRIKTCFRWLIRTSTSSAILLSIDCSRLNWHHPLHTKSWLTIALKLMVLGMYWNVLLNCHHRAPMMNKVEILLFISVINVNIVSYHWWGGHAYLWRTGSSIYIHHTIVRLVVNESVLCMCMH